MFASKFVSINHAEPGSHEGTPGEEAGRREEEMPGTQEMSSVSLGCWRMVFSTWAVFSHVNKSRNVYSGSQTLDL